MPSGSFMGNAVLRREDPDLLTGAARFVGDMDPPGTAHVAFVRSVMAHAEIVAVDAEAARAAPGVLGVFTAADLPMGPQHLFIMLPPELSRLPLADKARYVGDPIAAVVAESRAAAVDAAELVEVDYEPLVALTDPFEALAPEAPVVIEAHGSNRAMEFATAAEPDALADHDVIVAGRFVNHRMSGAPIEPSAVLAAPDNGKGDVDGVTLWCASQRPHEVRDQVAAALETAPEAVRVIAPAVGGGFGPKAGVYPEFVVTAWLAQRLGRPVKWVETRSENLVNTPSARRASASRARSDRPRRCSPRCSTRWRRWASTTWTCLTRPSGCGEPSPLPRVPPRGRRRSGVGVGLGVGAGQGSVRARLIH